MKWQCLPLLVTDGSKSWDYSRTKVCFAVPNYSLSPSECDRRLHSNLYLNSFFQLYFSASWISLPSPLVPSVPHFPFLRSLSLEHHPSARLEWALAAFHESARLHWLFSSPEKKCAQGTSTGAWRSCCWRQNLSIAPITRSNSKLLNLTQPKCFSIAALDLYH